MPRYDYDDDYEDRPRRRKKKSGSNNQWVILGVVGGVVLLTLAGCAGLVVYVVGEAKKGVDQLSMTIEEGMAGVAGELAVEGWLQDVRQGKTKLAYDATSKGFKAAQTQQQFEQFVAKNPTLSKHTFHTTTSNNRTGEKPSQKLVLKVRLHTSDPDEFLDEDDEEMPVPPRKKPKLPRGVKDAVVPEIDVTITLVEEDGVWKVDAITIP